VNNAYGANFATSNMTVSFPTRNEKEFCMIGVKRGKEPLYTLSTPKNPNMPKVEKFDVRSGNTSQELSIDEAAKYIRERFKLNS
jgi:hypothetical protein